MEVGQLLAAPLSHHRCKTKSCPEAHDKLGKLYDISDDMEVALTEIVDDDDEENTDL